MRTLILILIASLAAGKLYAQDVKMHIHLKDGRIETFSVDSVSSLSFTPIAPPVYSIMHVYRFSTYLAGGDKEWRTDRISNLHFSRDAAGIEVLVISPRDTFRLVGPRIDPLGFGNPLDSIHFPQFSKNPNTVALPRKFKDPDLSDSTAGDYQSSVWYANRVYASGPVGYFKLDSSFSSAGDSTFQPLANSLDLAINGRGDRLLIVSSIFPDRSVGALMERNLQSGVMEVIDSTDKISSAVYVPGTNNLIYYSYGSSTDTNGPGYYFLNRSNGQKTSLLYHLSDLGPGETINGFDISPDGGKLLVPSVSGSRMPIVFEYDLMTHISDTLKVSFDTSKELNLLWLRYNHVGSQILYGNYSGGMFAGGSASVPSEIGLIKRSTLSRHVLNTNPDNHLVWVSVLPQWSPDDKMIVFGSGYISPEPRGFIPFYQLYILTNFN